VVTQPRCLNSPLLRSYVYIAHRCSAHYERARSYSHLSLWTSCLSYLSDSSIYVAYNRLDIQVSNFPVKKKKKKPSGASSRPNQHPILWKLILLSQIPKKRTFNRCYRPIIRNISLHCDKCLLFYKNPLPPFIDITLYSELSSSPERGRKGKLCFFKNNNRHK